MEGLLGHELSLLRPERDKLRLNFLCIGALLKIDHAAGIGGALVLSLPNLGECEVLGREQAAVCERDALPGGYDVLRCSPEYVLRVLKLTAFYKASYTVKVPEPYILLAELFDGNRMSLAIYGYDNVVLDARGRSCRTGGCSGDAFDSPPSACEAAFVVTSSMSFSEAPRARNSSSASFETANVQSDRALMAFMIATCGKPFARRSFRFALLHAGAAHARLAEKAATAKTCFMRSPQRTLWCARNLD